MKVLGFLQGEAFFGSIGDTMFSRGVVLKVSRACATDTLSLFGTATVGWYSTARDRFGMDMNVK